MVNPKLIADSVVLIQPSGDRRQDGSALWRRWSSARVTGWRSVTSGSAEEPESSPRQLRWAINVKTSGTNGKSTASTIDQVQRLERDEPQGMDDHNCWSGRQAIECRRCRAARVCAGAAHPSRVERAGT
jgi:hypothetical protein